MVNTLKRFRFPAQISPNEEEWDILANELTETRYALQRTYLQFNSFNDPDLIESAVYEMKAQQARYSYLLRRIKALYAARSEEEA